MSKAKITAIVGSLRKESYNRQLALGIKEIIGDRADFELLDYSDVPLMNQDIEYPAPESVKRVRDIIKAADGIWFFTPEYNHSFSGVMKNLLDWLSRPTGKDEPFLLSRKPATISGITPGMAGTMMAQDQLVMMISFLNMNVMNKPRLVIPHAMNYLEEGEGDTLDLTSVQERMEKQADAFLKFIAK